MIQLYISNMDKRILKTRLIITGIPSDTQLTTFFKPVILVLAKPNFVQFRIQLILDNKNKAKVLHIYKNSIFPFIYNVRITILVKFPNFDIYNVSNFWLKTKVTVEIQLYSCNLRMKKKRKILTIFSNSLISINSRILRFYFLQL